MTRAPLLVGAGITALALAVGTGVAIGATDEPLLSDSEVAAAKLPIVMEIALEFDSCVYDAARGGLVFEDVVVRSRETGVAHVEFSVERGGADDVLPAHTSYVLTFDDSMRRHSFDAVLPMSGEDHEAGYDDCYWSISGS